MHAVESATDVAGLPVEDRAKLEIASATEGRRIRVAIFTNSVAIGGMEKHTELIVRDLDRSEVEVYAICPRWEPIESWAQRFCGLADQAARIAPDRRNGVAMMLRDTYRLWRQLRLWRIDVLHMHQTTYTGGAAATIAARLAGVKVLVRTEHLAPEHPLPRLQRFKADLITRHLNRIVTVSLKNRQSREAHLYTPSTKTTVVNNGIDVAPYVISSLSEQQRLRDHLGIPADVPIVGVVVRFEDEKGLNYLLDAMPDVLKQVPTARLLMVGDGSLRDELEQQASKLGVRDSVVFAGFASDPRPYLSLMNVFVLPVPFGSASIGLLEAMAMWRAVVITFGGDGEPVVDGVTGLYALPRDPCALATAILRILDDTHLERRLGNQARLRVENDFSSKSVARQLMALYAAEFYGASRAR